MQKQFYLAKNGSHVGPHSLEEVLHKISMHEHQWLDYVFDDVAQNWVTLMEHPSFSGKFSEDQARPQMLTVSKVSEIQSEARFRDKEWFTLRDGNNYGPFSMMDLIQMLQEKTLFEFDYVWNQRMTTWTRVAEAPEFKADRVRQMKESADADLSEIFFRRRHARARYGASVIVHDHKTVYRGQSVEISEGGAGLIIEKKVLDPGQSIYLHFQPGDGVPPFNAVCSVVNKSWNKEANSPLKYGVKFTSISQAARQSIRGYTEKKKSA